MRRDLGIGARLLVLPTLALLFVIAFVPGRTGVAVRVFALVVCGVALLFVLGALRRSYPPEQPLRPRPSREEGRRAVPATLVRIEQETILGVAGSFDLHYRLRPRLRSLAADLLATRRGVSLENSPAHARGLLGDEGWEVVRPNRPAPEDRLARGLPVTDLHRIVESLEQL